MIDEISMMSAELLSLVNERLQNITNNYDQLFGRLNVVFCGDLYQLPPVNATPIYKRSKASINNEIIWQSLEYYRLETIMRQQNLKFSNILTKIARGETLDDEEIKIIESRFILV